MTMRSLDEGKTVDDFQQNHDTRLLAATLSNWTERIIEIKSRELDVTEKRNMTVIHKAFSRWCDAAKRVENAKGLMQSFIDVKM